MKYGFGVDIGGTTVKIAFFDERGEMLHKWEIPTNTAEGGSAILPDIAASVKGFLEKENIARGTVIGIGVGVPGPVDDDGIVNQCVNLGWGVTDLQGELSALTGLPTWQPLGNAGKAVVRAMKIWSWRPWALVSAGVLW